MRVGTPPSERSLPTPVDLPQALTSRPRSPNLFRPRECSLTRSLSSASFESPPQYHVGRPPPRYSARDLFPQLTLAETCQSRLCMGLGGLLVFVLVVTNIVRIASQFANERMRAACGRLIEAEPQRCLDALPSALAPSASCLQDCIRRPHEVLRKGTTLAPLPTPKGEMTLAGGVLLGALSVTLVGVLLGVLWKVYRVLPAPTGATDAPQA